MTTLEVRKMAYSFMYAGRLGKVDMNHDNTINGSMIVESFIARSDDAVFIPGSWVVGMHIPDKEIWGMIKSGEINGFSMQARAMKKEPTTLKVLIPEIVTGTTDEADGHTHRFRVEFNDEGRLIEGLALEADGHVHSIIAPTLTEEADGHAHRFSILEKMTPNSPV
jgi:hypothetical protein